MIRPTLKINKSLSITLLSLLVASAFVNTGFSISELSIDQAPVSSLPDDLSNNHLEMANLGAGDDGNEDDAEGNEDGSEPIDVIKNGSFEERDSDPMNGVALEWEAYNNGQADFGWYDETWPEAVQGGEHAQLMEIFRVFGNFLDRVIAVYQTVNVVPNASYDLNIHALMRSDAPSALRNKDEYEMSWGIDYFGEGNYDNVEDWIQMPLTEQLRLGSHGEVPDNQPLFYEVITGTVRTRESSRISLFIRGVKKFPNGTEVNFDIDNVSLIGPSPTSVVIVPNDDTTTVEDVGTEETNLPATGTTYSRSLSIGVLILGGLIVVVLGAGATANLLGREET